MFFRIFGGWILSIELFYQDNDRLDILLRLALIHCTNIIRLDCHYCESMFLELMPGPCLEKLHLICSRDVQLPEIILPQLKDFWLQRWIPNSSALTFFEMNSQIKKLKFSFCKLQQIAIGQLFDHLPHLEKLSFDNTWLCQSYPANIAGVSHLIHLMELEIIESDRNSTTLILEALCDRSTCLQILFIDMKCGQREISAICKLVSITQLKLSLDDADLYRVVEHLHNLEQIDVECNTILGIQDALKIGENLKTATFRIYQLLSTTPNDLLILDQISSVRRERGLELTVKVDCCRGMNSVRIFLL